MSQEILQSARIYVKQGFFTIALEEYMRYLEETPEESRIFESEFEFIDLLCDLDIFFNGYKGMDELIKCYICALRWFPHNSKLLNRFGRVLLKHGDIESSLRYILQAYQFSEDGRESRLAIENNILQVMWSQLPRWHFRMLNGKLRNDAYKAAIHKAIDKGFKSVVDIGFGSGLLSLYAGTHKLHPSIIAFESNPVLYKMGKKLMINYFKGIDFQCYQYCSYSVDSISFKNRDLLITEIFDVAVFGEGILKSLSHAFKVLMQKQNVCVIPAGVTLYVTGIKNQNFDAKYRLHNNIPSLQIVNVCLTKSLINDPYDAEYVKLKNSEILTKTLKVMEVKFSEKDIIENLIEGKYKFDINVEGIKDGIIDTFVVWFDLHLDDEIIISTNPNHSQNEPCWEQAIFHWKHPIHIKCNEVKTCKVKFENEHLNFELHGPQQCPYDRCFNISAESIRFLNDKNWCDYLISVVEKITENERLTIVDFCIFPLMGLLLAKRGHEVYHFFKAENLSFIEYVVNKNSIDASMFKLVEFDEYPQALLSFDNVNLVLFEPVHQDGSLKCSPLDNMVFTKLQAKKIFDEIIVHFVIIHSSYLDYCNKVDENNLEPFTKIAAEINKFSGTEQLCLSLDFPHEVMSNEQSWNPVKDPCKIETVRATKDGKVNGILIWYTIIAHGMEYCTKDSTNFYKKSFIFPEKNVEIGELCKMLCQYDSGGFFKIEICPEECLRTNLEKSTTSLLFNDLKCYLCEVNL